jgi:integrase
MKVRLTSKAVDAIRPEPKQVVVWDDKVAGFGVRVSPQGRRTYFWQGRDRWGRQQSITIGTTDVKTADAARAEALKIMANLKEGREPEADKPKAAGAYSMDDLWNEYLATYATKHKKESSIKIDRWNFAAHVEPVFRGRPAVSITGKDIQKLLDRMEDTPTAANRVRALLSKMFSLAEEWERIPRGSNPAKYTRKFKEEGRERYLAPDEIKRLSAALDAAERDGADTGSINAIRLLLYTGLRKMEVLSLRWTDVDIENSQLFLRDSKTGKRRVVLNSLAVGVLMGMRSAAGESAVLFPSRMKKASGGHLTRFDVVWDDVLAAANIRDFRIHDLRHSFASLGVAAGQSLPTLGGLLGHKRASTTQKYAHLQDDPLRQATEQIGEALKAILKAGKS